MPNIPTPRSLISHPSVWTWRILFSYFKRMYLRATRNIYWSEMKFISLVKMTIELYWKIHPMLGSETAIECSRNSVENEKLKLDLAKLTAIWTFSTHWNYLSEVRSLETLLIQLFHLFCICTNFAVLRAILCKWNFTFIQCTGTELIWIHEFEFNFEFRAVLENAVKSWKVHWQIHCVYWCEIRK